MLKKKTGVLFSRKYFGARSFGSGHLSVFIGSLALSLLFLNLFVLVQVSEAKGKSVSSVATAGQSGALTYGTAATATFKVTVSIAGTGAAASVTLAASPAIAGVTYGWYDSTNTTLITWPRNVSKTTTFTLRVTTTATAAATAGTTIKVTDMNSGMSGSSTVTINKAALTITAATNTKTYDGTPSAPATPGVTGLKGSDTVTGLAEAYADKRAETNKTLNVTAYTVNDGNSGNNYTVTTLSNTTGVINAKNLTVTGMTANNKVYDGNTSATLNTGGAALFGVINGDVVQLDTSSAVGTFSDSAIGANKTVYISGLTLSGTDAANYALTQPTTTANIMGSNIAVSPTSPFDFGGVNVGLSSSPQTFTISNTGNVGLQIVTISLSNTGEFALSNDNCSGKIIAASGNCTLQVTFTPSTSGSRGATLSIPSNDPDSPTFSITLNGTGEAGSIKVSPTSPVDFGSIYVGSSSSPQTFAISNTGSIGLQIATISSNFAGEFAISNDNCSGKIIAASGNCTLQVTFMPLASGSRGATLSISSNDPDTPNFLITLNGTGNAANIGVSPTSPFDFGSVNVGSSSPQTFAISNTGNIGLQIATISSSNTGEFVISNDNCSGQPIAASGSCTLQVTFTPSTYGSRGATLSIPSNDPDSPTFSIALSGTGKAASIEVSPASPFDFASVNVGSSSSAQTFTVSNTGNTELQMAVISSNFAGEFVISNDNCSGQTLAASGNCTLQVTFLPSTYGSRGATLSIPSNDPDTPTFSITLSGTGKAASIEVSPASPFDFASVNVGSTSSAQTFTISNPGNLGLQIATISSDNTEFAISSDNCSGQTLAASGNCTLQVTFIPSTYGSRGATLSIPSNDPDTPIISITLSGRGKAADIDVSPTSPFDFGSVNVGSSSSAQTFTVSNTGNTGLQIATISSDNPEFAISSDNCSGQTIAASGNCTLQVTFTPSTYGSSGATLSIPSNDPYAPIFPITLIGTGEAGNIQVSPMSPVDFGSVNVGSSSSAQTFTVSNIGSIGLQIGTISSDNTEFAISSDNCSGQTIAASGNCTLQVTFTPSTSGSGGATLSIPSNDLSTPIFSIILNGFGLRYTLYINSTGNGKVESTPPGISCVSGSCSAKFNPSSIVTLRATNLDACPSSITWSGPCAGNGLTCDVTMNGDQTENVTFTVLIGQVKNMTTNAFDGSIQDAYDNAGSGDVIRAAGNYNYVSPAFDLPKDITLQGGYNNCNFTDPPMGVTTLNGPVVISDGSATLGGIVIY